MNTNTNNLFQTTPIEEKTTVTTTTTGKKLESPIDERAGKNASSTMSALGPHANKRSTTKTTSTASENPFATPESGTFGCNTSSRFPPASSTTTADSAIDTNSIPLISPAIPSATTCTTTTTANPSAHAHAFTSTSPQP